MRLFPMVCAVVALAATATPLVADDNTPQVLPDGLELVEKDSRGEIYADPDVDWSVYDQIQLDPATVAFRKFWQRDQNRNRPFKVRASDMERIKSNLSELFNEVFTKELTENGGYVMATESADNVLRISPQIVNLDVYAPDTPQPYVERDYTRQAGQMTLQLELYDSVTGDLLATASDRQDAPYRAWMQWTTRVSNQADARRMLENWARDLRERLDEARSLSAQVDSVITTDDE